MKNKTLENLGPVEIIALSFPKPKFEGKIVDELKKLVDKNIIRIIDIILVKKDEKGNVTVAEMSDAGNDEYNVFKTFISEDEMSGLLSEKDAREFTPKMENDSAAAVMLFENKWATDFVNSVVNANGELLVNERIPRTIIEDMVASTPA